MVKNSPSGESEKSSLRADRGDIFIGLMLLLAALVFFALTVDVETAAAILAALIAAYALLGIVVSLVHRNLRRGFATATRWTAGTLGRWFSFW